MAKIIKDRQIVEACDSVLRINDDGSFPDVPAQGSVLVSLKQYLVQRDALLARGDVGVWFAANDEVETLGHEAAKLALIAVEFPAFTDGRGFTTGRLLRERFGFSGELRAFGEVFKDTLNYLARCGFNSFALCEDKDPTDALLGLDDFTEFYQAGVTHTPLFRRRELA